MSAFSTMDVRAPDQRRKQLIKKLMAQASSAGQTAGKQGAVAALRGAAGTFGAGPSFGNGRRSSPSPNVTQGSNILPAILAKLGITGTSLANEASSSPGAPIPAYGDLNSILQAAIAARSGGDSIPAWDPAGQMMQPNTDALPQQPVTPDAPQVNDPSGVATAPVVDNSGSQVGQTIAHIYSPPDVATDTPSPPSPVSLAGPVSYDPVLDALFNQFVPYKPVSGYSAKSTSNLH